MSIDWVEAAHYALWISYLLGWFVIDRRLGRVQANISRVAELDSDLALSLAAMVEMLNTEKAAREALEEKLWPSSHP